MREVHVKQPHECAEVLGLTQGVPMATGWATDVLKTQCVGIQAGRVKRNSAPVANPGYVTASKQRGLTADAHKKIKTLGRCVGLEYRVWLCL